MTLPIAPVIPRGGTPAVAPAPFRKTFAATRPSGVGSSSRAASIGAHAPVAGARAAQVLDRVRTAQARLDRILALAKSGRTFTPAELLVFQGQVYGASQEIELASRVVEKGSGGVKQVLQTQV